MVFYRCPHEAIFGNSRCQDEPVWVTKPELVNEMVPPSAQCKLNSDKCGKLIRIEEAVDLTAPWLLKPEVVETVTPKDAESKEKGKGKSKGAKKLEGEIAQKSMF